MSEEVSLYDLLNLSIESPQEGSVNFGALHSLLLAMLKQLDLREVKTRWRDSSPGYGSPDVTAAAAEEEVQVEVQPDTDLQKRTATPSSPVPGPDQLNLLSRIQTCEDGLSKSTRLILDLKEQMEELRQQHEMAGDLSGTAARVESCCHRVDALEETVKSLRDAVLPGDREGETEKFQKEPGDSGVDDPLMEAKQTSSPSGSDLTEPPQSSTPPSSHADEGTFGPAASSSPNKSKEISTLQEEPDTAECASVQSGPPPQTSVKADSAAAGKPPTSDSNNSTPSAEAVEALRSMSQLQERLVQLEARVAALEKGKVDQSQLVQLRELIAIKGSCEDAFNNLMDQLNEQRALIDRLMSDRGKLDDLEDMLTSLMSPHKEGTSEATTEGAVSKTSERVESKKVHQSEEWTALNARTANIGEKLSLLFERYEQLQDVVNRLLQQQGGAREGPSQDRENVELVNDVQQAMLQLQADCKKLNETTRSLHEDSRRKQRHIEELYKAMEELEVNKADKQMVESEIKSALEGKVSRLQFDSATERLSGMFHELLNKVTSQEQDWHKLMGKLSTEMECKLNRIELDSVKKQLEDRWRSIHEKLLAQAAPEHEDAAGIRKQLVERFHCLSCDRPVVKHTPGPHLVTLPSFPAFPSHKSIRPFTTYTMEQLRQQYRSERISELMDYSDLAAARSCSGSHHTNAAGSQRRGGPQHTKLHSEPDSTIQSEEVDIVGLDGRVYKGRLPMILTRDGVYKTKDKARPAASPEVGHGSPLHQPCSRRSAPCSRSASSCSGRDWPVSALGCASQSSIAQASAAAESTAEPRSDEPLNL